MIKNLFVIAALFLLPAITLASPVAIGKKAPDFMLHDLDGNAVKLSDYKGKIVVLEWINEGCPFSRGHYLNGHIPSMQQYYTSVGVIWLTVNSTRSDNPEALSPADAKAFLAKWHSAATHNLVDEKGKVGHLYGAKNTPHFFILDGSGILRYQGAIDDDRSTDGGKHANINYVLKALDALMVGKEVETTSTQPYGCSVKY